MKYIRQHDRKRNRLKGYDYSRDGAYFVTACIQNRKCLLGEIGNDIMELNDAGRMVQKWWHEISKKFPYVILDEFVVMPNHIHGIIFIQNNDVGRDKPMCLSESNDGMMRRDRPVCLSIQESLCLSKLDDGATHRSPPTKTENSGGWTHRFTPTPIQNISRIMQWFKTMTTNEYIRNVKLSDWEPFDKKLWQRSFHDRIIRDPKGLENIREYIIYNPLKWESDAENPKNVR